MNAIRLSSDGMGTAKRRAATLGILLLIAALTIGIDLQVCEAQGKKGLPGEGKYQQALKYHYGFGEKVNFPEAIRLYREAAAEGNPFAMWELAFFANAGTFVLRDQVEAERLCRNAYPDIRKAAEQGNARAQFYLGWMYGIGRGVAKDEGDAVSWYRKAAAQNNPSAQDHLGSMYLSGLGVAKDDAEAVNWRRKAAEQNYPNAQVSLGNMYAFGLGVTKDDAEAVNWYRKAAAQNHPVAQFYLGNHYANGRGVAKDEAAAVNWYRKAAEQNHDLAHLNLGIMYENGRGVTKDLTQAVSFYRKAAEQGYELAKNALQRLMQNPPPVVAESPKFEKKGEQKKDVEIARKGWSEADVVKLKSTLRDLELTDNEIAQVIVDAQVVETAVGLNEFALDPIKANGLKGKKAKELIDTYLKKLKDIK